jgi:class 3 adenylate cyclase
MPLQIPETRYAKSGDVNIAYQVSGEGPFDVVLISPYISHVELAWNVPGLAALSRELASFCRLVRFDKRGTGMSDPVPGIPPLEERMDDVRAVLDAVGSERAAILGHSEGGPMSILFAATYPERVWALVLEGTFARTMWAPDYAFGARESDLEEIDLPWPERTQMMAAELAPSTARAEQRAFAEYLRRSASPGAAAALRRMNRDIDVRHVLSSVQVPTLVMHKTGESAFAAQSARYLAENIHGARHVELPGADHAIFAGRREEMVREIKDFLAEAWADAESRELDPDRVLATVLFTDIVGSTAKAAELGDRGWRELLGEHHHLTRRELSRFRGREIDTAGDGFFASFDGPARAIRCACSISEQVQQLGIEIRAGLHSGECELLEGKVAGIAVSIGARVAAQARPSEILVSQTVKDLVAGSGIEFADRGAADLKGVPGEWRLFAVQSA